MLKIAAMYLPQFHQVRENDQWWGEGFTDWRAVKNARPLYAGHRQPRIPLGHNYYDLLEHDVMVWQAKIAREHGLAGFCFYHYWFKDGQKILEKPAENLLAWEDIDIGFCFSWANETWARTWSNVPYSNSWVIGAYEPPKMGVDEEGILLKQNYGGEKEWEEHFRYLLPFFKDPRYFKHGGKPILLIHKPCLMYSLDNMMECWDALAVSEGLPGLYVVATGESEDKWEHVDAKFLLEFDYSDFAEAETCQDGLRCFNYEDAWERILATAYRETGGHVFYGGFVDVDDTPRRGCRGVSTKNASPGLFEKYLRKLADIAIAKGSEFIFINAWNEWGEGAYLEPDEDFGYGYLEAVERVMEYAMTAQVTEADLDREYGRLTAKPAPEADYRKLCGKYQAFFRLMDKWMSNMEQGKKLADYFEGMNFHSIAVYGYGALGRHLHENLEGSRIKVPYVFDKASELFRSPDPRKYAQENFPGVDAVIVTPIMEYKDIRKKLKGIYSVPVISLEEVIGEW